ncbi:MAG: hypothetical protein H6737_07770 [Alphaproteobacteria bacterium]|nr:hypothetical protein [Alphaproteobacteria bacterium]
MFMLLALLAGCQHDVNLRVLRPADVTLPADVQRIAVLNRSRPGNTGQGVLDTIEGIVTGEAPGMDREGSTAAVHGVVDVLRDSPRFDAAIPLVDQSRFPSDIFDKPLTRSQVKQICRQNQCDALVALDAFDTDSVVSFSSHTQTETDDHGREINVVVHDAVRDTRVVTSWRLYYAKDGTVLDEVRDYSNGRSWSATGRTRAAAAASLANPYDTARVVGSTTGRVYGQRIAPLYVWVDRIYYGGSDPRFKEAKRHAKANDWKGAKRIWEKMVKDDKRRVRGKALYNLALIAEIDGDLFEARRLAKKAAVQLANGQSRSYVRILDRRIADEQRLNAQMAPPPPPAPKPGRPVHPAERDEPLALPADTPEPKPKPAPQPAPMTRPQPKPPMERPR